MEGQSFSHYEVLERLGGGGMGVVHKALDKRLNRHVALKFLPNELTRDDEARTRFVQEAQAASALDHPNICTIHEIDSTPEGQLFIAMAFYDGATLKRRINDGPLPIDEAVDIASQIARGLTKAHSVGIVHRDIKPANVMVTKDGFVKVVDFGIAKLLGVTGPTQAGSTLGTVSYMAPEQVAGEDADPRSDVWALGALLYEMLTGKLPFKGENLWAVMNSIANNTPESIRSLRPGVTTDLEAVVMDALEKDRAARTQSVEAFRSALEASQTAGVGGSAQSRPSGWRRVLTPETAITTAALVVLIVGGTAWLYGSGAGERWAREEALPEIQRLIDADRIMEAFDLVARAEEHIPDDRLLAELVETVSLPASIMTEPADASVSYRPYGASDDEWRYIGQSPLDEIRLPRGVFEWRIEKEGYETENWAAANPSALLGNLSAHWGTIVIPVTASDDLPTGMVNVPAVGGPVSISGFNAGNVVQLDPFLVDRHEVTNREFKEFVDAGGYEDPSYWDGLEFRREGREITWEGARRAFIDSTGRLGPATWEAGDYPRGEAEYPVGGVSWYEAMAYARFAGKSLPTVYHWSFAALAPGEIISPIGPAIVPMSNFAAAGPARVGSSGAVGPYGTYDTAGNVREWALNASGNLRWILGGGYDDPSYMFSVRLALPPMDRSPLNGFRSVSYSTELTAELSAPIEYRSTDYRDVPPVSDEVYEIYSRQLSYEPSELAATVQETYTSNDWSAERVSYNAGYDGERIDAVVFVPTTGTPPFPALVVFPGLGGFQSRLSSGELRDGPNAPDFSLDFVLKSGRALVLPTWNGSFERWDPFLGLSGLEYETTMRERVGEWRRELGMTIDYLAQRDDIDERAVGYLGMSFGASAPLALLAVEDRLRTAVLVSGGFSYRALPDAVHPVSFVERTTLPVLMVNGRYDYVYPLETGPIAYFDRLGTPAEDKSLEIVEAGHWPLPRGQLVGYLLDWLDDRLRPEG